MVESRVFAVPFNLPTFAAVNAGGQREASRLMGSCN